MFNWLYNVLSDPIGITKSERRCVDIYQDFSEEEVLEMPPSVQHAWYDGRDFYERFYSNED